MFFFFFIAIFLILNRFFLTPSRFAVRRALSLPSPLFIASVLQYPFACANKFSSTIRWVSRLCQLVCQSCNRLYHHPKLFLLLLFLFFLLWYCRICFHTFGKKPSLPFPPRKALVFTQRDIHCKQNEAIKSVHFFNKLWIQDAVTHCLHGLDGGTAVPAGFLYLHYHQISLMA